MIRHLLSAFQSITPVQLSVRIIMSPSENFLKDALAPAATLVSTFSLLEMPTSVSLA